MGSPEIGIAHFKTNRKKGEINMAKKEERFEVTFRDGSQLKDEGVRQILVDKETGVNYLCSEAFQYLRLTVQSD